MSIMYIYSITAIKHTISAFSFTSSSEQFEWLNNTMKESYKAIHIDHVYRGFLSLSLCSRKSAICLQLSGQQ